MAKHKSTPNVPAGNDPDPSPAQAPDPQYPTDSFTEAKLQNDPGTDRAAGQQVAERRDAERAADRQARAEQRDADIADRADRLAEHVADRDADKVLADQHVHAHDNEPGGPPAGTDPDPDPSLAPDPPQPAKSWEAMKGQADGTQGGPVGASKPEPAPQKR